MNLRLLLLAAAMFLQAFGAFIWDATQIVKQRASDAVHAWHDQKGNDIMCALMSTDLGAGMQLRDTRVPPSAASRHWGRRKDGFHWNRLFEGWFWHKDVAHPSAWDMDLQGWTPLINHLKPASSKADWMCRRYLHRDPKSAVPVKDQTYVRSFNGKRFKFQATGAVYNHAFHPDGMIIFQQSKTPLTAAHSNWGGTIRRSAMPHLYHASDFLFSDWKSFHRGNGEAHAAQVEYCGNANVGDRITYSLLARYLMQNGQFDMENWPALNSQWSTQTPEGRALLASPAASECVNFLLQHKEVMGIKYILRIAVFRGPPIPQRDGSTIRYPQFVFEFGDVPQNLIKPNPPPNWVPPAGPGVLPPITYIPVQVSPDFDVPGPSNPQPPPPNPQPAPPNPQPVIPGPSTPHPGPPPKVRAFRQEMLPEISYKVHHEGGDKNFVRVHTFQKA